MKHPYTDLESTIQQYVLGRMSESEVEDFEDYYFDKPDVIEMIETVQNIHAGLQSASTMSDTKGLVEEANVGSFLSSVINWISLPVPAYTVMLLTVGFFTLAALQRSSFVTDPTLVHFTTLATRGVQKPVLIDLMGVSGQPAVIIKLRSIDYQYHVLRLSDVETGQVVWTSEPFEVGPLGEKLMMLPSDLGLVKLSMKIFSFHDGAIRKEVEFCHFTENCNR